MTLGDGAPAPEMTFAVGDIHGRDDLLERAIAAIKARAGRRPFRAVFLGDYVNRGPDSRGVIERLMGAEAEGWAVCLNGNHEEVMLRALVDPAQHALWMRLGGEATLRSYGGAVPRLHVAWLQGLPSTYSEPGRLYVHAGVHPSRALAEQGPETFLWIREPFLEAPADALPCHVVHGHSPRWRGKPSQDAPELLPHRTNLDTAAYATGRLSVGIFDASSKGGPREVLTITVD